MVIRMSNKIDLFEVVLKDDLDILLTPAERVYLDEMEDEIKQPIYLLVNNDAFLDQIEDCIEKIIRKASVLSEEEQKYISQKCEERIRNLRYPSLSSESFDIKSIK